jgi:hypothetical protein
MATRTTKPSSKKPGAMGSENTISVRIPPELKAELEAEIARMREAVPGVNPTLADAVRNLLWFAVKTRKDGAP